MRGEEPGLSLSEFCGVRLSLLPDFLLDHTMLQERWEDRLPELASRWTQFVRRLWTWHSPGATFVLRYHADPNTHSISIFVLARPHDPASRTELQADLIFALQAYGILTSAQSRAGTGVEALTEETMPDFSAILAPKGLSSGAFVAVVQTVSGDLWKNEHVFNEITIDNLGLPHLEQLPMQQRKLWIPLIWSGPSGSFLIPIKALTTAMKTASQPIQLSITLVPTTVTSSEMLWLENLASHRQPSSYLETDHNAPVPDLSATRELGTALAESIMRKLQRECFAVSVSCLSLDADDTSVDSIARSLQALCMEPSKGEARDSLPGVSSFELNRRTSVTLPKHIRVWNCRLGATATLTYHRYSGDSLTLPMRREQLRSSDCPLVSVVEFRELGSFSRHRISTPVPRQRPMSPRAMGLVLESGSARSQAVVWQASQKTIWQSMR